MLTQRFEQEFESLDDDDFAFLDKFEENYYYKRENQSENVDAAIQEQYADSNGEAFSSPESNPGAPPIENYDANGVADGYQQPENELQFGEAYYDSATEYTEDEERAADISAITDGSVYVPPPQDEYYEEHQIDSHLISTQSAIECLEEISTQENIEREHAITPAYTKAVAAVSHPAQPVAAFPPLKNQSRPNPFATLKPVPPPQPPQPPQSSKYTNWKEQQKEDPKFSLTYWNLPSEIVTKYEESGIKKLYPWQVGILSTHDVLVKGENLIYCAPTSGGKTLVAEVLMARRLQENKGKKCFFIVPFVAIAEEKTKYLKHLFEGHFNVEGLFGAKMVFSNSDDDADITVCTMEKANNILNNKMAASRTDDIAIIVIDEIHMIKDPERGYILELLLTKLMFLNSDTPIQIIGLSATLPNVDSLANWLGAHLFVTNFRPIPLTEHYTEKNKVYKNKSEHIRTLELEKFPKGNTEERIVCTLVDECIQDSYGCIVFAHSRTACEHVAKVISEVVRIAGFQEERNEVKKEISRLPGANDPTLEKCLMKGVAYHHAGMTTEEREIIEDSFRAGIIQVIVATTTLSAGVNLPARRVVFYPRPRQFPIDATTYKQAAGRAGRAGRDVAGESYFICIDAAQKESVTKAMYDPLPSIVSCLMNKRVGLRRALLEVIAGKVVGTVDDVKEFIGRTLLGYQYPEKLAAQAEADLKQLIENELIQWDAESNRYKISKLGSAIFSAGICPTQGLILYEELTAARKSVHLDSDVHLLYISILGSGDGYLNGDGVSQKLKRVFNNLDPKYVKVAEAVGLDMEYIQTFISSGGKISKQDQNAKVKRFMTALALQELIDEKPLQEVLDKFYLNRGVLQKAQREGAQFAAIICTFCFKLNWKQLEYLFRYLKERLHYGVQQDILPLCQLPSVKPALARHLYEWYKDLESLATANPAHLESIIAQFTPFRTRSQFTPAKNSKELRQAEQIIAEAKFQIHQEGLLEQFRILDRPSESMLQVPPVKSQRETSQMQILYKQSYTSPPRAVSYLPKTQSPNLTPVKRNLANSFNTMQSSPSPVRKPFTQINANAQNKVPPPPTFKQPKPPAPKRPRENEVSVTLDQEKTSPPKKTKILLNSNNLGFQGKVVYTDEEFSKFLVEWQKQQSFSIDFCWKEDKGTLVEGSITTVAEYTKKFARVVGMGVCWNPAVKFGLPPPEKMVKEGYYVVFDDNEHFRKRLKQFEHILQDKTKLKVCYSIKEMFKILLENQSSMSLPYFDPKIAAWMNSPDATDSDTKEQNIEELINKSCATLAIAGTPTTIEERCLKKVVQAFILGHTLYRVLETQELMAPFQKVEMPLIPVLALMEFYGVGFDKEALPKMKKKLNQKLGELTARAYELAGREFAIQSPPEVAKVLFDELKLTEIKVNKPTKRKGPARNRCTDKSVLRKLVAEHDLPDVISTYRSVQKAISNHGMGLDKHAYFDPDSNMYRIYSTIVHTTSATGRLGFINPNMQNVPNAAEYDKNGTPINVNLREAIVARSGYVLMSADYSQIEVRILTHFSKDPLLTKVMHNADADIFRQIASHIHNKKEEDVLPKERDTAKSTFYALLYGMGARTLGDRLDVDEAEAASILKSFSTRFSTAWKFMDECAKKCEKDGFVLTLFNRKRYFQDIQSPSSDARAAAQRAAKNTVCQGSAADLAKAAMLAIYKQLKDPSLQEDGIPVAMMLLQIHDEIVLEVKEKHVAKIAKIVKKCMEETIHLAVPTPIKIRVGKNWGSLEDFKVT